VGLESRRARDPPQHEHDVTGNLVCWRAAVGCGVIASFRRAVIQQLTQEVSMSVMSVDDQ
jgi:hypothetical protein